MPTTSRSTPSPNRGSSSSCTSIGTFAVRRPSAAMRLIAARQIFATGHVRAQGADRTTRLHHVRARELDRGLDAHGSRRRQHTRLTLSRLQLHQDRARSPGRACRECHAPVDSAPRGSLSCALRSDSARPAGCDAGPTLPAARSPRSARCATTVPNTRACLDGAQRQPAKVVATQNERGDDRRFQPFMAG